MSEPGRSYTPKAVTLLPQTPEMSLHPLIERKRAKESRDNGYILPAAWSSDHASPMTSRATLRAASLTALILVAPLRPALALVPGARARGGCPAAWRPDRRRWTDGRHQVAASAAAVPAGHPAHRRRRHGNPVGGSHYQPRGAGARSRNGEDHAHRVVREWVVSRIPFFRPARPVGPRARAQARESVHRGRKRSRSRCARAHRRRSERFHQATGRRRRIRLSGRGQHRIAVPGDFSGRGQCSCASGARCGHTESPDDAATIRSRSRSGERRCHTATGSAPECGPDVLARSST